MSLLTVVTAAVVRGLIEEGPGDLVPFVMYGLLFAGLPSLVLVIPHAYVWARLMRWSAINRRP